MGDKGRDMDRGEGVREGELGEREKSVDSMAESYGAGSAHRSE